MKKFFVFLFPLFLVCGVRAQYRVEFIVKEKTTIHHDSIFITGTFNNWDSLANKRNLMRPHGEHEKSIVLNIPAGTIRYKFNRGNWLKVEKEFNGTEVRDRVIKIARDTILIDSVSGWRDEAIADKMLGLAQTTSDTSRVELLSAIASIYAFITDYYNVDSALLYAQAALLLYQEISSGKENNSWTRQERIPPIFTLRETMASLLHSMGNYQKSLELRLENMKLAENGPDKIILVHSIRDVADDYAAMKDYLNVLKFGKLRDSILAGVTEKNLRYQEQNWLAKNAIAIAYYNLNEYDSALHFASKFKSLLPDIDQPFYVAFGNLLLGDIYSARGEYKEAFICYRVALDYGNTTKTSQVIGGSLAGFAKIYQREGRTDSALYYARLAMEQFQNNKFSIQSWGENTDSYVADLSPLLAEIYQSNHQPDSAYKYLRLSIILKDSLYNASKVRQFQNLSFNETVRRQQLEQQNKEAQQQSAARVKIYSLAIGMLAIIGLAFILYRNNKQKQKANLVLLNQKKEIETTLTELKITQSQLIQAEKMASLGELTAGIAHEIQNPLNFVNNFSEVNTELIEELKSQKLKVKSERDEKIESELIHDIGENEKKINLHGKRADAIVKGMLQHSRSNTGAKEAVNINSLVDEWLRRCYHGLRAKDQSLNITLKTDFDASLSPVSIIPQDIGRVLFNLFNNAFYAVSEKKKLSSPANAMADKPSFAKASTDKKKDGYEPTVIVTTRRTGDHPADYRLEIRVKDNGSGIPEKIAGKIFQPFFTTKPTGQGTGLGLSLSYDIIKAHNGELTVTSPKVENPGNSNEGAEFIIQLPYIV